MAISLTLSQIISLSGGNARRMKHLANEGVFIALDEARPSRAARSYSISEAALACIVSRLDRFNIPAGTLHEVAESLRNIYRVPLDHGFKTLDEANRFWAREMILILNKNEKLTPEQKKEQAEAFGLDEFPRGNPAGLSSDETRRIHSWVVLEKAREGDATQLSLSVHDDGSWLYWLDSQPRKDDNVDIYIVINLHHVLSVLR